MLNKYFKLKTDLIIYLQKFYIWIICHILCAKRYIYSINNLFRTNLERFIITTEVPTGMSVRPLNHILCCFNSSTNWELDQMGQSQSEYVSNIYGESTKHCYIFTVALNTEDYVALFAHQWQSIAPYE